MSYLITEYSKKMRLIAEQGDYQLFEYLPSVFKPLAMPFENLRLIRRLRFLYEYLHKGHYKVYYLAKDNLFVGYCVVCPGGRRLWLSKTTDIVIGPYFILPQYRGKGYAKILLRMTLKYTTYPYNNAYDWIHKNNLASIRTTEACGFVKEGNSLEIIGISRNLIPSENGSNIIYVYSNSKYT